MNSEGIESDINNAASLRKVSAAYYPQQVSQIDCSNHQIQVLALLKEEGFVLLCILDKSCNLILSSLPRALAP